MGCGDHWPTCEGRFIPPLERPDLIIEVTHRYIAVALSLVVVALLVSAIARHRSRGPDLRKPAALATALVVAAALLGAATVKLILSPLVVVAHLVLAMALLATLAWFTVKSGGFGATTQASQSSPAGTQRSSLALAAVVLVIVVLGALTANVPAAAGSCAGFPHCREIFATGVPLWLHLTHRLLAFAVLGHVIGVFVGARRRSESGVIRRGALLALILIVAQVLLAAAMVEMRFPPALRSAHQALGSLIWLTAVTLAFLARVRGGTERAA